MAGVECCPRVVAADGVSILHLRERGGPQQFGGDLPLKQKDKYTVDNLSQSHLQVDIPAGGECAWRVKFNVFTE